ncbi:hypothetical protein [Xanthomonas arboricola]
MAMLATNLGYIRHEMFGLFIRWIFPIAAGDEVEMALDRNILVAQAYWLDRVVMRIEDQSRFVYLPGGTTRQLRRLLQIDFGFDFLKIGAAL